MKTKIILLLLLPLSLFAQLNVAVTYPYIGAITKEIAGDTVNVTVLAQGNWDPHFVVARPSLIAKLRNSDALIINGAQLEIGWVPALVNRAANAKVMPNAPSFLDLSTAVKTIQVPQSVDRSQGDLHPFGNPHFHLDPFNIILLAQKTASFLARLDPENAQTYKKNYYAFASSWKTKIAAWDEKMKDKKGLQVLQFHDVFAYFNTRYGIKTIGTIEPLPGIPASSRHTIKLIKLIQEKKPYAIMHDVYHPTKTATYMHDKTGIKVIMMPHDIGALDSISSLEQLFDYLTSALNHD